MQKLLKNFLIQPLGKLPLQCLKGIDIYGIVYFPNNVHFDYGIFLTIFHCSNWMDDHNLPSQRSFPEVHWRRAQELVWYM